MKTSKRFLSIVLMLAMLVSMFTVMAFADDKVIVNFVVGENGKAMIENTEIESGAREFANAELNETYVAVHPDPGYVASVSVDNQPLNADGFNLSADYVDKTITITFSAKTPSEDPKPTPDPVPEGTVSLRIGIQSNDVQNAKILANGEELDITKAVTFTKDELKAGVTLTTSASEEEYSVKWTLNGAEAENTETFKLPEDLNNDQENKLLVEFISNTQPEPEAKKHTLSVSANSTAKGSIKYGVEAKKTVTFYLKKDEKVSVKAVAKSGYKFSYWTSDDITIANADMYDDELTITMPDKNAKVTAVFVEKSSTSCSHSYVENYNDTYHWKECKYCGAIKSGSKEKHDLYSYKKNGYTYKYCIDCDYDSYTYDYDKHPSSHDSYVYTDLNATYHLKECAKKGCSYEVKEYHTWIKNTDRKTKDSYPYVCKYCDRLSKTAYTDLPFRDVDSNVWYYDDVLYAYINGYMDGLSAGQFAPNQNTTRAQIVTILWRLTGEPRATKSNKFNDVSSAAYYDKAVSWAVEAGVVNGFDAKTFKPNDYVTREQLAAILYRYAEYMNLSTRGASNLTKYDDYYQIGTWARDAMAWANYHGLINGVSYTRIDPKGCATRAQVAAILHRFAVEFGNY